MNNDVTTIELRLILSLCGYSQADFARYIRRSPSFAHKLCIPHPAPVPLRWVDMARAMVGESNFEDALIHARIQLRHWGRL